MLVNFHYPPDREVRRESGRLGAALLRGGVPPFDLAAFHKLHSFRFMFRSGGATLLIFSTIPPHREVRRAFQELKFKQILIWKKLLLY